MGRREHASETPATVFLRQHKINFSEHIYDYVEHGGTAESSRQLEVPEHDVVKTLVMQDQDAKPLIILMQGDHQVIEEPGAPNRRKTCGTLQAGSGPAPHRLPDRWHFAIRHAQASPCLCGALHPCTAFDLYQWRTARFLGECRPPSADRFTSGASSGLRRIRVTSALHLPTASVKLPLVNPHAPFFLPK